MGSYGVIKEALLVKQKESSSEYYVVQKLVPATVNGMVMLRQDGGFALEGLGLTIHSVYRGGAFGFSESSKSGDVQIAESIKSGDVQIVVNIPGYGVKLFHGKARIEPVNGVGLCVMCTSNGSDPTAPYTNLCLVVESPGSVFKEV